MDLIKLLANNLHVLIIIAAVLGSIMIRLRAATRQRPAAPMPPFGGGRHAAPSRPSAGGAPMTIGRKEQQPARSLIIEDTAPSPIVRNNESPRVRMTEPVRSSDDRLNLAETDGNDVVRGIIWAELLGPPRAKRPYGRR